MKGINRQRKKEWKKEKSNRWRRHGKADKADELRMKKENEWWKITKKQTRPTVEKEKQSWKQFFE